MTAFSLQVAYSQVAVFNGDLSDPFNDWTAAQVAQGFSWRPGSVSFQTRIEAGPVAVDVKTATDAPPLSGIRVISVPFTVSKAGEVEVASIADGQVLTIPPGDYQLLFETGDGEPGHWCRLTFVPGGAMTPRIIRFDAEIVPPDRLIMDAEPA